jgi:hypothetical protein
MFGKQGKPAKAPTSGAIMPKKNGGKGVGLGQVAKAAAIKGIKGNKNKLK